MTDTSYEPEMRRFRELMQVGREERAAGATTALEQRNLEEFQRIMAERGRVVAPRDPETRMLVHSSELGEPGLPDAWVRARVAVADTREERQAAFNQVYPFGEIRPARDETGTQFEIYRRDPGEEWRKFDPSIMEKFEPAEDIADFASTALPIAGEIAVTRGAGGLTRRTLQTAAGAGLGELAEEGLELAGGQQRQAPGEVAGQVGAEALTAGLGSLVTEPIAAILNARRGAGTLSLLPGAPETIQRAERLGLEPLMPYQVAEDPIVRTTGSQAEALTTTMTDIRVRQQESAVAAMNLLRETGADPENLPRILRARIIARQNELDSLLAKPGIEKEAGGEALQAGLREYDVLAIAELDDFFQTARDIEEPEFDWARLDEFAENMLQGLIVREDTARPTAPLSTELRNVLEGIRALAANHQPIVATTRSGEQITISVTDQLRGLRERVWDLKTVDRGQIARRPEYDAGALYGEMTDTLNNPTNTAPDFVEAWKTATNAASDRFATWDRAVIQTVAKSEDPVALVNQYVRPDQVVNLRWIRDTVPAENWRVFTQAAKQDFLGNLDSLTRRLDDFDQPTLNMLFTNREQEALRLIGRNWDNMAKARDLAQFGQYQDIANRIIRSSDGETVQSLTTTIGGPNSPDGKALRAGMINTIVQNVVEVEKGVPRVNRSGLETILRRMDQNGSMRFLTDADREALETIDQYMDFVTGVPDVGTSLMRASIVKQLRELNVKAAFDIVQAYTVGRLMTTPQGRRFLMGRGQNKLSYSNLRLLGAATATIAADTQALGRDDGSR